MMAISINMTMMMRLLSGTKAIKNVMLRKQKLRKNFCLLPGIHLDGEIGESLKIKRH